MGVGETRPLRECGAADLRLLLAEESAHWATELEWDWRDVSAAVAAGLERGTLTGRALRAGGRPVAYCYYLVDEGRVVVGSLFASRAARGRGLEEELLDEVLDEACALRRPGRVECQTLFSTAVDPDARFARAGFRAGARLYMQRPLEGAGPGPAVRARALQRGDLPAAAALVHRSHVGSLDAALNLTYSSPASCRGFLDSLVLRAGCGPFDPDASALVEAAGRPVAVLVASRLSAGNGHVCQVSVAPEWQGRGLGRGLVERACRSFAASGLKVASLSVTVANRRALQLYELLGFRTRRAFAAHAWVRPPARLELPA